MSYTPSFYRNYHGGNFTFQNNVMHNVPYNFPIPPPPPPPVFPFPTPVLPDEEFVKKFENRLPPTKPKTKISGSNISKLRDELSSLTLSLNDIKIQEGILSNNLDSLSEDEWQCALKNIEVNKNVISEKLSKLAGTYLDLSRKLLAKRSAKRLRMKRRREVQKREKNEMIKQRQEMSRKIDENLQKIKDDILKTKLEEEAKLQADVVLKEVLRKKHDAKRSIVKLDALVKLRRARQNTARGKGQPVPDVEASVFQVNVEKLKSLWTERLVIYEKEEAELRAKLKQSKDNKSVNETERRLEEALAKWKEVLFGGRDNPQVDFNGDLQRFIAARSEWDRYIDKGTESTPVPVGWVMPIMRT